MGKTLSHDLRLRLIRGIADGKSQRAVAPSTAVRFQARKVAIGSIKSTSKAARSRATSWGAERIWR